jgi:transcriptional regulator with XRE-family HTH domain
MTAAASNPSDFELALGRRLRAVRDRAGMSLSQVEAASGGRLKAVVVGSHERADRAVTVERLWIMATFYNVPVTDLPPYPPLVAEAFAAITAAAEAIRVRDVADKQAELERTAESYQRELADLMASIPAVASR